MDISEQTQNQTILEKKNVNRVITKFHYITNKNRTYQLNVHQKTQDTIKQNANWKPKVTPKT